jgi:hypothetical protein
MPAGLHYLLHGRDGPNPAPPAISKLEAKLASAQIEATALAREIRSPLTSAQRRQRATDLRGAALADSSALQADLDTLGTQFPDLARH